MGIPDYALVHLKFTIPPAIVGAFLLRPLQTRLDTMKLLFLIAISITATIPWDSYLIRTNIWSYPDSAIYGPTLFDIPLEELFFFFIQTYNTSLLYIILGKPLLHPLYLSEIYGPLPGQKQATRRKRLRAGGLIGGALLAFISWKGWRMVSSGGEGTYLGLILVWTGPILLFLWSVSYLHILSVPLRHTLLPIVIPTIYLCLIDTFALRRGTWVISSGTKFNIHIWPHLEIEEAIFFLLTNVLIVFGLVSADYSLALIDAFPSRFHSIKLLPSPKTVAYALTSRYNLVDRYAALPDCVLILKQKSRSFYLASSIFEGRLRMDLISLYAFCRAADDLIDEAGSANAAYQAVLKLRRFLNIVYGAPDEKITLQSFMEANFPPELRPALLSLPSDIVPRKPLDGLLDGFTMDLGFPAKGEKIDVKKWPIKNDEDLRLYSARVAGTIADLCISLITHHFPSSSCSGSITEAGIGMGCALQYINIARDIFKDAELGRVYIPLSWLSDAKPMLTPRDVIANPSLGVQFRERLLKEAMRMYAENREAMESLPMEARKGVRVAVETYVNIGRDLERGVGRVGKSRRMARAWMVARG